MLVNRRRWLGGMAGVAGAAAVSAFAAVPTATMIVAADATLAFRAVLAALGDFAAADLVAHGFPGMTIAVRAADGQTATLALGQADLATRTPVRADHLFQIGSISKSLVALALYTLAGQGRLGLAAPVAAVVPEVWLEDRAVTIAQLLAHSAGLPDNSPMFPPVPGGKLWSATPPGSHFSYSNAGYDLLALVVERVTGMRYDRALTALVLEPLGMRSAVPVIRTADRGRFAAGYVPFDGDVAWFPHAPLAPGVWLDIDRAAGSVAATAGDMVRYLGFVAGLAQGRGAPLFSAALAQAFATPVIDSAEFGKGARYGAGLATVDIDGTPAFHHTGGMLVFSSAFHVDRATGAGVFASVNIGETGYRPRQVTAYGVRLLRALAAGTAAPSSPAIVGVPAIDHAADFAGRFVGPGGDAIVIAVAGEGLSLTVAGRHGRLKASGDASSASGGASFASEAHRDSLAFVGDDGRRDRVWFGDVLYGRDAAVAQPVADRALVALAGVYRSNDPWVGSASIVARGDTLVVEGGGPLRRVADGSWRFADAASTERVWFECPVAGRPQRLNVSGSTMLRFAG